MDNNNEKDESMSNETDEQQVESDARWWDDWTNEWDGWEDNASDDQQLGRNDWVQDSDGAYRIVDKVEDIEIVGEETLFIDAADQIDAVEIARQRTDYSSATYHVHHCEDDGQ
jgi:hypothetical protein